MLAEVKLKLNAACTAANVATREFRTFLRSADQNNQLHKDDERISITSCEVPRTDHSSVW